MTSNFLYLGLSTLHFSFLWRTAKTIFAQSNNPTPLNKAPGTTLGGGGEGNNATGMFARNKKVHSERFVTKS